MKITIQDILPMDVGSSVFTEYDLDDRFVDFIMEDEVRMDWKVGHIHSHNTMDVFFSGTDNAELLDNAKSHNFYLSLIVNNYTDLMARVAVNATVEERYKALPFRALDEDGMPYTVEKKDFIVRKEKTYFYECAIQSKAETVRVPKTFEDKVYGIMQRKKDIAKKAEADRLKLIEDNRNKYQNQTPFNSYQKNLPKSIQIGDKTCALDEEDTFQKAETEDENEAFTIRLLHCGDIPDPDICLEDTLIDLEAFEIKGKDLAELIMSKYAEIYDAHFEGSDTVDVDTKLFGERTEAFIEILREWEQLYPVLTETIDSVDRLLAKFEDYGTAVR